MPAPVVGRFDAVERAGRVPAQPRVDRAPGSPRLAPGARLGGGYTVRDRRAGGSSARGRVARAPRRDPVGQGRAVAGPAPRGHADYRVAAPLAAVRISRILWVATILAREPDARGTGGVGRRLVAGALRTERDDEAGAGRAGGVRAAVRSAARRGSADTSLSDRIRQNGEGATSSPAIRVTAGCIGPKKHVIRHNVLVRARSLASSRGRHRASALTPPRLRQNAPIEGLHLIDKIPPDQEDSTR